MAEMVGTEDLPPADSPAIPAAIAAQIAELLAPARLK